MTWPETLRPIFDDWHLVEIRVPTDAKSPMVVDGLARKLGDGQMDVQIFPLMWPIPGLDPNGEWQLHCEQGMQYLSLKGRALSLSHPRQIRLQILSSQSGTHTRNNLRVDTEIYLSCRPNADRPAAARVRPPVRRRVSLSSNGLGFFSEECFKLEEQVRLSMILPAATLEHIDCLGTVLRMGAKTEKGHKTALAFADILPLDTERIELFCLTEQFKNMQSRARFLGMLLASS